MLKDFAQLVLPVNVVNQPQPTLLLTNRRQQHPPIPQQQQLVFIIMLEKKRDSQGKCDEKEVEKDLKNMASIAQKSAVSGVQPVNITAQEAVKRVFLSIVDVYKDREVQLQGPGISMVWTPDVTPPATIISPFAALAERGKSS